MGFRFRRSAKIAPGVRLNATHRGVGASAGIPGTGLSWSTRRRGTSNSSCIGYLILVVLAFVVVYWIWQFITAHWIWLALAAVLVGGVVLYRRRVA